MAEFSGSVGMACRWLFTFECLWHCNFMLDFTKQCIWRQNQYCMPSVMPVELFSFKDIHFSNIVFSRHKKKSQGQIGKKKVKINTKKILSQHCIVHAAARSSVVCGDLDSVYHKKMHWY